MKTQFKSVVLFCEDVPASRDFYMDLFDLEIELDLGGMVSFKGGLSLWAMTDVREMLFSGQNPDLVSKPGQEIYFETDDIISFIKKIENQDLTSLHQMQTAPWNQRVIRFFDPDNHLVEVGESMEVVVLRFVREGLSEEEISSKTFMPPEFIRMISKISSGNRS